VRTRDQAGPGQRPGFFLSQSPGIGPSFSKISISNANVTNHNKKLFKKKIIKKTKNIF